MGAGGERGPGHRNLSRLGSLEAGIEARLANTGQVSQFIALALHNDFLLHPSNVWAKPFHSSLRAGACRLLVDGAISHHAGSEPHGCIQAAGRGTLGRAAGNEDNVAGHQLYVGTLRGQNLLELDGDLLLTLRRLAYDLRLIESGGAIYSFRHSDGLEHGDGAAVIHNHPSRTAHVPNHVNDSSLGDYDRVAGEDLYVGCQILLRIVGQGYSFKLIRQIAMCDAHHLACFGSSSAGQRGGEHHTSRSEEHTSELQ